MTIVNFNGLGPRLYDSPFTAGGTPAFATTGVIDASGEKFALMCQVFHSTLKTGTINIRKVELPIGAVTQNVLSTVRLSLQNFSLTAGPPFQPDGTQDQTFDWVGASNPLTANSWNVTGNLSADRAVDLSAISPGDANSTFVAVVVEYSTFTALDSVVIRTLNRNISAGNSNPDTEFSGSPLLQTSGTWNALAGVGGIVVFECDDGSKAFGVLHTPYSAFSSATVASNGAIRAAGLYFSVPLTISLDEIGLMLAVQNGADGTLILYDTDGTTVIASVTIDNDVLMSSATRFGIIRSPGPTITANAGYRLVFVASTTTSTSVFYADVAAAVNLDGVPGGSECMWTQRDSAGVWTETTTRRPWFILTVGGVDIPSGGGNTYSRSRVVNA